MSSFRLRCLARRFRADVSGATAVLVAMTVAVFAGVSGFVVDGGQLYYQKRRLQTAADLAALAAASDLPRAHDAATAALVTNGFARENIASLQTGAYTGSLALAPDARFSAGGTPSNAARIELTTDVSMMMAPVMNILRGEFGKAAGSVPIRARATAASEHRAAFSVGSRLLALNGGVLNGLLGALLGSQVSLSIMDYNSLASANIDLFGFSDALATRLSLNAVSYDQLLATQVRLSDVFAAAAEVSPNSTRALLSTLSQDASSAGLKLTLRNVFSVGVYGSRTVGQGPALGASVSALDLVSLSAEVANGNRQVSSTLNIGLPPVASVALRLGIGERPVHTAAVVVGSEGASAHTAQTRLLLTADLVGSGHLSLVKLPLYVEVAAATARLKAISCPFGDKNLARVTISTKPAVVDAWIGAVGLNEFYNMKTAPSPGPATLVDVFGLARINARAHVTISNLSEKDLVFSAADIAAGVRKTVSTTDTTSSLLNGLLKDLKLDVNVLGFLNLGVGDLVNSLASLITVATPVLDQVLDQALRMLGISIGQAEVAVSDVICGTPVLVN